MRAAAERDGHARSSPCCCCPGSATKDDLRPRPRARRRGRPRRHPLHRGRHRAAAPAARARARVHRRRLPDDGPHDHAGRPAGAGADHGRRRRPGRLRHRLGRRARCQGDGRARGGDPRRASAGRGGRLPRPPEPDAGVANSLAAVERRRDLGRRLHLRHGRRRRQHADRGAGRGAATAAGSRPAIDMFAVMDVAEDVVRADPRPTRRWSTVRRCCSATRACTPRSCSTPSGRPSASASRRRTSCSRSARRKAVGGQEDMIVEVAAELAA